jgi:flagellar biosynthesis anti-sigma factor FlgM
MKITHRGPADADLSQRIQNDKTITPSRRDGEGKAKGAAESAKVSISAEARKLQQIAELARTGDEIRAEKVDRIKDQIAKGQYQPDVAEVSKSILRSEISRLLEKK